MNVCFPHEEVPHNKYMIVVAVGNYPLLLKINTSEQQSEIARKMKEHLFKIKKSTYDLFLEHDSYVDCGTVWWTLLKTEEIVNQLKADPSRIKGDVSADHKNEIIRLVEKSKSIEPRHKRIIAEGLRE